jgi:diaminohydroxyphosphoribosylaminopyrimidine deaminase/5-amino-6-(5-phosphoribosylamino)uracil reductase
MFSDTDRAWMRRALELAKRGWGQVRPNPMVGAVVVREGENVGEGWHAVFGGPHAEVVALGNAGERARGATLYVSLEPCSHHGKTPPCTAAILAAGIGRVVFAARDPNPEAAGGGRVLEAHGVHAEGGLLEGDALRINAAFRHAHETGTPWIALKLAASMDGRIARRPGERTAVSGPESGEWVQWLRAGFDALMVGATTARVDDPLLTVRGAVKPRRSPVRVVVDSTGSLDPDSALARSAAADAPVLVLAAEDAVQGRGVEPLQEPGIGILTVPRGRQGLDLAQGVDALWRAGVRSILCEGGGRLGGSLLAGGLVNRIYLVVAPFALGADGVPAFPGGLPGRWAVVETRMLGRDGLMILEPA